MLYELAEVL